MGVAIVIAAVLGGLLLANSRFPLWWLWFLGSSRTDNRQQMVGGGTDKNDPHYRDDHTRDNCSRDDNAAAATAIGAVAATALLADDNDQHNTADQQLDQHTNDTSRAFYAGDHDDDSYNDYTDSAGDDDDSDGGWFDSGNDGNDGNDDWGDAFGDFFSDISGGGDG